MYLLNQSQPQSQNYQAQTLSPCYLLLSQNRCSEPEKEIPSEPQETPMQESQSTDDDREEHIRNVIYVGTKQIMTYVTATLTQLSGQPTVTIKARGKRI